MEPEIKDCLKYVVLRLQQVSAAEMQVADWHRELMQQ